MGGGYACVEQAVCIKFLYFLLNVMWIYNRSYKKKKKPFLWKKKSIDNISMCLSRLKKKKREEHQYFCITRAKS